jgi:hypothetical protein
MMSMRSRVKEIRHSPNKRARFQLPAKLCAKTLDSDSCSVCLQVLAERWLEGRLNSLCDRCHRHAAGSC